MDHPGVMTLESDESKAPAGADGPDVERAAAGDARAFERLYRRHVPRVHSLARRMLGNDDATEATQDVFVRAWQKLGTFRGEAAFGTWLHRLAINVMMTRRSALGTRRARFIEDDAVLDTLPARGAGREMGMDFETAIGKLPQGARAIFLLHDVEGYRHEEIAGMMQVTTGTTKAQLHRARMMLRRHLES